MEFITAKQFLEQPKEVQEVFRDWCEDNLQVNDFVVPIDPNTNKIMDSICLINECKDTRKDDVNIGRVFYLGRCLFFDTVWEFVPLFTEGQLRKFIEDKTYSRVSAIRLPAVENKLVLNYINNIKKKTYTKLGFNLLQAYYKVALEIAKEVSSNDGD